MEMFESIDSSPNNLNSSIRRKREHRKSKRTRLNDLLLHRSFAPDDQNQLTQLYYEDSEEDDFLLPATHTNSFKRFQAENMMVNADPCYVPEKERNLPELTQQFYTCESLIENNLNAKIPNKNNAADSTKVNFETEWLLKAFEEDDMVPHMMTDGSQNYLNQTLVPKTCDKTIVETTPQWENNLELGFMDWSPIENDRSKTIVETILEDFCTSSVSSETKCASPNLEDFIPFFRFRRKKIRTYERCWRHRHVRRASRCVETTYKPDDEDINDGSSSSSELSVQEDLYQVLQAAEPLENLNSTRIRNNLLNLSAFFTQNLIDTEEAEDHSQTIYLTDPEDAASDSAIAPHLRGFDAFPIIIMEINTLRAKYKLSDNFLSLPCNKDFRGFPLEEECVNSDTDRRMYDEVAQRRDIICRSAPDLLGNYGETNEQSTRFKRADVCGNSKNQETSFDEESWHYDNDFFVNFQTQSLMKAENMNETIKNRRNSDSTVKLSTPKAMKNPPNERKCPTEAHNHDWNKLTAEEEATTSKASHETDSSSIRKSKQVAILSQNQSTNKIPNDTIESQIPVEEILRQFESQKNIRKFETSKSFDNDFDCMVLSEWPLEEPEFRKTDCCTIGVQGLQIQGNRSVHASFQQSNTLINAIWSPRSSMSIRNSIARITNVSNSIENRRNSLDIEQHIQRRVSCTDNEEDINFGMCFTAAKSFQGEIVNAEPPDLRIEQTKNEIEPGKSFTGFQTASRKAINVSKDARKKIGSVFANLPDIPGELNEQTSSKSLQGEIVNLKPPDLRIEQTKTEIEPGKCFTGFQTASRKAINVSEDARKKIENVFANLPDFLGELNEQTSSTSLQGEIVNLEPSNLRIEQIKNETEPGRCFTGLQTESRKSINVSEDARKKIKNVFAQLPDLPGDGRKKESHESSKVTATTQTHNFQDFSNISLSEWIPYCDSTNLVEKAQITTDPKVSIKRRLQTDNCDPPAKIICKSRTLSESSTHTPTSSIQNVDVKPIQSNILHSKIIGRKNLLSLTKRRRESLRGEGNIKCIGSEENTETPVKLLSSAWAPKNILNPHTPQAGEFNAQQPNAASTPHSIVAINNSTNPSDTLDFDFKRINWENNDDLNCKNDQSSATPTRLNNSDLNKSLKPLPSPQDRIENLSSCGDPPPLPQLVDSSNRSRRLGMSRRQRSCIVKI